MLGDGSCEFTEAMGLTVDRREAGMGIRSQRYSMIVDDGVVKELNVEPSGEYGISSAETMLQRLEPLRSSGRRYPGPTSAVQRRGYENAFPGARGRCGRR